jgi:uncharacterized protein (DUF58 family)
MLHHPGWSAMNDAVRQRRGTSVSLTLRGSALIGAALLAFSSAYIASWPELLVLACFCGIPPLLALAIVVRGRPRLTIARFSSPPIVSAGATGSARLRLGNIGAARTAAAHWTDSIPWSPGTTRRQVLPVIAAGNSITLQYAFVPPRRGIVELGPLLIEVVDMFGLARGVFPVGDRQRVTVAPEVVELDQGAVDIASDSGSARLFQHRALAGEHDVMTRDYRPGDALRRVHWKASAHHGELMVREDEKRSHAEALLLVDTRRSNWRDVSRTQSVDAPDSERFEWALSLIASLRDHLIRNGLRVSVIETAVNQLADAAHADDFVESLARVRLSYQDGPTLRLSAPKSDSSGTVFAVVDAADGEIIDALIDQRGAFDLAVAFLLGPPSGDREERLARAGWIVHRVGAAESVLEAWRALGAVSVGAAGGGHDA